MEFRGTLYRNAAGRAERLDGVVGDVTERRLGEERRRELMHELDHRVKNILAMVQAIASQTARSADSVEAYKASLTERLRGLAATHDLLTQNRWEGVMLRSVLNAEIAPYESEARSRIALAGPDILLPPALVTAVGLAIHELTTNAVKYGALSNPSGQVNIEWSTRLQGERPVLHIEWREIDGPPVAPPSRIGFGSRLIERVFKSDFGGDATLEYLPDGLRARLVMPLKAQ
jgi:two-component sensor histidine kinase